MFRVSFRQIGRDLQWTQEPSHRLAVVCAIGEKAFRAFPRTSSLATKCGHTLHEGNNLRHVVPIGPGDSHGYGNPLSVNQDMVFGTPSGAIRRVFPGVGASFHGSNRRTVHNKTAPSDPPAALQFRQQQPMEFVPNTQFLPIANASPTGHPRTLKLAWQQAPWDPRFQHEHDCLEDDPVIDRRPAAFRSGTSPLRQERLDPFPQPIRNSLPCHAAPPFLFWQVFPRDASWRKLCAKLSLLC
jgi:hypothetical protein